MKKILSISPWPSVWSQGEGGGSPSEFYAIQAMGEAGFGVTHLSPVAPGLPYVEDKGQVRFVRIANPFTRLKPLLKTGIAFAYRLPAIIQWTSLVSRWLRKSGEHFDLVVGHSSESVYAMRRAARYLGVPALSRLYGISASIPWLKQAIRRELYFDLLSLFRCPPDRIILTNDGTCGEAAARIFGIPNERYDFLLNGYDPSLLSMPGKESSPAYILTASRLVDWKRADRVVRIAVLCKASMPELNFIILGDGPEKPSLEKLIRELGVSATVSLAGRVSRVRMYEFLSGASAVLATQDLSNLNNTVLEALVLGKPVLTLDTGCTRTLIHHGETGFLYPPDDLQALAQGIKQLIYNKALRKSLGEKAGKFSRKILKPWPERVADEAEIYRRFLRS